MLSEHVSYCVFVWAWMHWQPYALEARSLLWFGLCMDALVTVCFRNTNVILVLSMDALVNVCSRSTKLILVWFGYGSTGNRMLSKHKRYSGFGMDALVTVCSRNTSVILVSAWTHWQPYALET